MKSVLCATLLAVIAGHSSTLAAKESPPACEDLKGARLIVDVGSMRSEVPSLTQEELTALMGGVAQHHASETVQFRQGVSSTTLGCASARRIPVLRIDGVALTCRRTEGAPQVWTREARVDVVVRRVSDQTLQAVLHGKAAAPAVGASDDSGLCRDLVEAASSSAIAALAEPGANWR